MPFLPGAQRRYPSGVADRGDPEMSRPEALI